MTPLQLETFFVTNLVEVSIGRDLRAPKGLKILLGLQEKKNTNKTDDYSILHTKQPGRLD